MAQQGRRILKGTIVTIVELFKKTFGREDGLFVASAVSEESHVELSWYVRHSRQLVRAAHGNYSIV